MKHSERIIAHVDMDAFFAAIEVRDHPEYRGLPVVVGAGPRARGVIAAASYEARRYGIHSAMPSRRAFALCPGAVFLPPDMDRYHAESQRLLDLLETFTPQIEPVSVDEAFLDLTGCPVPAGGPPADLWACGASQGRAGHHEIEAGHDEIKAGAGTSAGGAVEPGAAFGRAIQQRIHERLRLPASVGVAPNKFLAKVASELAKPDGVRRIPANGVRTALDPLPVGALWGVGAESAARLQAAGITTVGALRRTPVSTLRATLGFAAERLAALSRGEDDRPVDPGAAAKSIGREVTFDRDTRDPDLLARTLRMACEDVARRLRADGLAGRIVTLKVRFAPFETLTRRATLPAATDHGGRVAQAITGLWRRLEAQQRPLRPVRLVGVTASGLERPLTAQVGLFGGSGAATASATAAAEPARHRAIDRLVDTINERFGSGTVMPARVLEPGSATSPRAPRARRRPASPRREPPA